MLAEAINYLIAATVPNSGVGTVTGDTTLDKSIRTVYCDTTSVAITITLPPGEDFMQYRIINTGATGKNVTITPSGSELLLGANSTQTLSPGDVIIIEFELTSGWW
jgi:hypothetical protein